MSQNNHIDKAEIFYSEDESEDDEVKIFYSEEKLVLGAAENDSEKQWRPCRLCGRRTNLAKTHAQAFRKVMGTNTVSTWVTQSAVGFTRNRPQRQIRNKATTPTTRTTANQTRNRTRRSNTSRWPDSQGSHSWGWSEGPSLGVSVGSQRKTVGTFSRRNRRTRSTGPRQVSGHNYCRGDWNWTLGTIVWRHTLRWYQSWDYAYYRTKQTWISWSKADIQGRTQSERYCMPEDLINPFIIGRAPLLKIGLIMRCSLTLLTRFFY